MKIREVIAVKNVGLETSEVNNKNCDLISQGPQAPLRQREVVYEDEIAALTAFINQHSAEHIPHHIALARAVRRRNKLATERFLALAHARWSRLLRAAGQTHGPIHTAPAPTKAL